MDIMMLFGIVILIGILTIPFGSLKKSQSPWAKVAGILMALVALAIFYAMQGRLPQ